MRNKHLRLMVPIILSFLLIIGCGGKKEAEKSEKVSFAVSESGGEVKIEAEKVATTAAGDWKGIPFYPGAKIVEKVSVSLPASEEMENLEYRFLEVKDEVGRIAAFYQAEMPKRGWEGAFFISENYAMGNYQKQDDKIIAVITINKEKDKVSLMLATGKAKE
jgi:hypothetical protein